jgi:hypothetical protein
MDAGPGTPPPEYNPSVVDRVALDLFHRTMSKVVGETRYAAGGFKGMVRTARLLSTKYNSASKTQAQARMVYHHLLPPGFPTAFKLFCRLFPGACVCVFAPTGSHRSVAQREGHPQTRGVRTTALLPRTPFDSFEPFWMIQSLGAEEEV